ncbi:hypothetical protein AB0M92_34985 [Streptomyces sp. NPDC051582]|uniref:hypothetical protein n=1 Tax=Streptomyces sp. NPDC051582 TaxID=3155167 RepID=UPI00343E4D41
MIFTVLFWTYGGHAHLTNQWRPARPDRAQSAADDRLRRVRHRDRHRHGTLPLSPGIAGGAFLAPAVASALWWTYCVRDEGRAEEVFAETAPEKRFKLAMLAYYYYYAFPPMLLGTPGAEVRWTPGRPAEATGSG